jgi:hypothetical protein
VRPSLEKKPSQKRAGGVVHGSGTQKSKNKVLQGQAPSGGSFLVLPASGVPSTP